MKSAITGRISINEIPRLASIRASIVRWAEASQTDSPRRGPPPSQGSGGASRRPRRSGEEMNWAKDPRVLVCIIAALILVVWMVLQQQYY
jgi:hypothetical protein